MALEPSPISLRFHQGSRKHPIQESAIDTVLRPTVLTSVSRRAHERDPDLSMLCISATVYGNQSLGACFQATNVTFTPLSLQETKPERI